MLKNYFKIAWRNLLRHKSYSLINIAGLAAGIASCLLIFVVVNYELSFETYNPNYNNIYRVTTRIAGSDGLNYTPGAATPVVNALQIEFPEARLAAFNTSYGSQFTFTGNGNGAGDKKIIEPFGVLYVQPKFFDMFAYKWLAGNKAVLNQPNMVVLDRTTASKYFGSWNNAVGKTLKMDNLLNLKVAGIIEDAPSNTDFQFKVVISYITWQQSQRYSGNTNFDNDWGSTSSNHQVYMQFPAGASLKSVQARLNAFAAKVYKPNSNGTKNQLEFQPLSILHFDTRFGNSVGDHQTSMATLRTLFFIAALIIVMASINFINLSTAQSVGRSKEVGVRKVLGSSRWQLMAQVLGETLLIVIISVMLGLLFAKLALPYLKNIASVPADIGLFNISSMLFLLLVTLVIVLLSGIHPALTLSGFKPVLALKNKINAASVGGIPLRRVLVVAQFAISQVLLIGTIVAVKQMNYVNNADLGFNKDAVLIIPGYTDSLSLQKMASVKEQLLANPQVKSVTFASDAPSSDNNWVQNVYFDNNGQGDGYNVNLKYADADYFKTFDFTFLAGHGYAQSDTLREVVINEALMHRFGIQNPQQILGKVIKTGSPRRWVPVVGVIKNFKLNSLRDEVRPILLGPRKMFESQLAVKLNTAHISQTVAAIKAVWERNYPEYAYDGAFLDERIAQFYQQENQLALVYKVFAGIAIFISCLGLYGLVSFMTVQKTKEVGVRKVLGASVASIVYLFSKEFVVLIGISFLIAMPTAWYIMSDWLSGFTYRIGLSPGIFILAVASSLLIAWATVGYKAIKAALVNPVRSLRSE